MRLLITTLGSYGDLNPLLGLASELKNRGHHVAFATSLYFRKEIELQGFRFYEIYPNLDPNDPDLKKFATDRMNGPKILHTEHLFPVLEKSYHRFAEVLDAYDMVVSATLAYFAPLACQVKQKPWVSVSLSPMLFWSTFDPPVIAAMPFLRHLYISPGITRMLFRLLFKVSESWLKPYHALRKKIGLRQRVNPLLEGAFSPYGTLAFFSEKFGSPQADWPAKTSVTGFSFYDKSTAAGMDPALERFLLQGHRPLLFTLGTTTVMNPGKLYDIFFETQRQLGFKTVVLTGRQNYERYKNLASEQVYVAAFAPYSAIMPKCSIIIHQGGVGTTAQALRSGNPTIIIPHCNDQFDNAFRVQKMGISGTIPFSSLTPVNLSQMIRAILDNELIRHRANCIKEEIRKEDGEAAAADKVEQVYQEFYQVLPGGETHSR